MANDSAAARWLAVGITVLLGVAFGVLLRRGSFKPKKEVSLNGCLSGEELRASIEYYKTIITTQTHFNDMLIRTRWFGLTVVATLLAVTGASLTQAPSTTVRLAGVDMLISGTFALSALLVSVTLFMLDRLYYFPLLSASVAHGEEFEKSNARMFAAIGVSGGGLTSQLSAQVGRRTANAIALLYWGFPAAASALMIFVALPDRPKPVVENPFGEASVAATREPRTEPEGSDAELVRSVTVEVIFSPSASPR